MSDIKHYSSRSMGPLMGIFEDSLWANGKASSDENGNVIVKGYRVKKVHRGETRSRMEMLSDYTGFRSKLVWGELMRNAMIFGEISVAEPVLVVDLGVGQGHELGRFIAGQKLDTHYLAVDAEPKYLEPVLDLDMVRPVATLETDLAKQIPIEGEVADYVVSTATASIFLNTKEELESFLAEVHRILVPGGVFFFGIAIKSVYESDAPLQHAHMHESEFSMQAITEALEAADMKLEYVCNYRVRPAALIRRERDNREMDGVFIDVAPYPMEMRNAFMLPGMTHDNLLPGNVLMRVRKSFSDVGVEGEFMEAGR
jgi:SAM-dependent methyltransferase